MSSATGESGLRQEPAIKDNQFASPLGHCETGGGLKPVCDTRGNSKRAQSILMSVNPEARVPGVAGRAPQTTRPSVSCRAPAGMGRRQRAGEGRRGASPAHPVWPVPRAVPRRAAIKPKELPSLGKNAQLAPF